MSDDFQNPLYTGGHARKLGKAAHLATCAFHDDCMYIIAALPVSVESQEDVNLGSSDIAVSRKATFTLIGTGKPSFGVFAITLWMTCTTEHSVATPLTMS